MDHPYKSWGGYTRARKQSGEEFKDRAKIIHKLMEGRAADSNFRIDQIADMVGLTVVVYYPDQVGTFLQAFAAEAKKQALYLDKFADGKVGKVHKDRGYHATHVRIGYRSVGTEKLRVEMQIKTMLHDAWGAKTHDLTYKPAGELDPRLKALMESFGESLQAIEVQSQTLRDSILSRVELMRSKRRDARLQLMSKLTGQSIKSPEGREAYENLILRIKEDHDHLSTCPPRDADLADVLASIKRLEELGVGAKDRLKLIVALASYRDDEILDPTVDDALDAWKREEQESGGTDAMMQVWIESTSLYQTNRLSDAIATLRRFLAAHEVDKQTAVLANNLVNYITEACLDRPKIDKDAEQEVASLLHKIEPFGDTFERSAYLNTRGAYLVVFGDESKLDEGLGLIWEASKLLSSGEAGHGYCELYQSHGWRRKLRL
ncbi:hypothetical protein [Bradyrhizobium canariense]|uniref:hypothetical protein n=1 Tax=Bradyrhizobium canariense TaxID=255045 RepID=UPI000A199142|nr:hypothetical protein [Bradyrhizobium canariense]OSI20529.1 hypothetical protein BST65_32705 [Bradyrhizobium canariense]OSI33447.1 hypothetical protein BST66_13675 [Bradyrhizobium canariense]OSI39667.1 hypothetical protein BSZ20_29540 [Bradyrhizobium canariense]OSI47690.1 hypothetical protein BST67_20020 [Bradyrhizobium canariense]OSI56034.1 hypothetical protein BSZ15_18520 [Bradyrhizobium canariense]